MGFFFYTEHLLNVHFFCPKSREEKSVFCFLLDGYFPDFLICAIKFWSFSYSFISIGTLIFFFTLDQDSFLS